MTKSHRELAVSGVYWMMMVSVANMVLKFLIIVVLSRLLTSYEFGIVAAVQIVITFADIFWMMGVGPAIVQKKILTEDDIITGNILNIAFGLCIYVVILLSSHFIAEFVGIEDVSMLKILSIVFVIHSLSGVSESLLQKDMNFKSIGIINVTALLLYGVMATLFSLFNFGAWSLVIAQIIQVSVKSILTIWKRPVRISLRFRIESAKSLLNFGTGFTLSRIFNNIANQGDYFVVNKTLGSAALGYYNRAYQLLMVPTEVIGTVLDKVLFPLLSRFQDKNEKLSYVFLNITSLVALIACPITVISLLIGEDLVQIVLGSNWGFTVVPFKILIISLFCRMAYKICDALVRSLGAIYKRLWVQIVYAATIIFGALIGKEWGINGVAITTSFAIALNYIIMTILVKHLIGVKISKLTRCLIPIILLSCVIYGFSYLVSQYVLGIPWILIRVLIISTVVGLMYLIAIKYIKKLLPAEFQEFITSIIGITFRKILPNKYKNL